MLSSLLFEHSIFIGAEATGWQQATRLAGGLLAHTGAVEPGYVEAMVTTVEQEGAYMVLTKGFALCHARPEDGVNRRCVSAVLLQTPVAFGAGEKDPVDVIFAIASPNEDGHVLLIQELVLLLLKPGFLEALRACTTPQELVQAVKRFEQL